MTIGFAHRGARLECPDNTMAGFARALELGASAVESDAWVSADGVAVLDHDGVVRRGLRRHPIAAVAAADLPAHVPTLAELYDLVGDVELSLDVKDPAALGAVLDAAGDRRAHLWLCHHDAGVLGRWSDVAWGAHLVHSGALRRIGGPPAVAGHARRLVDAGVAALNLRGTEWTRATVDACHDAGVAAFGWDAQTPALLAHLVDLGLDAVYSDHVADMVAALG